jgi:hypothetical protein
VDQDGEAGERDKLFWLRAGHTGSQAGSGQNYEYLHNG